MERSCILFRLFQSMGDQFIIAITVNAFVCKMYVFGGYWNLFFWNRTDYSQLHSLRTIRPGDVITFNLYIPFSFYDAIVVDWELLLTAGNMRKLTRPFSTLSEEEVFGLLTSLLDEFLRIERKKSIENLDIYVKDTSEQGGNSVLESIPYQKVNTYNYCN